MKTKDVIQNHKEEDFKLISIELEEEFSDVFFSLNDAIIIEHQ